jgi:hypothetical protein
MLKPGVFSVLSFIPILLRSTAHVSLLLSLARTYNALLSLSPSLSGGCGRSEVSRSQSLIKNPDFLSGTYRAQPLGEGVARTPSPAPALRALRWPPRLSQKYARRDGVETRPYQRDERQSCGSPAPPAPLPRCGRGGIVNAVSLKDVGAGSPLLSTRSKSRVSDHSLTYLLLTVALPELG